MGCSRRSIVGTPTQTDSSSSTTGTEEKSIPTSTVEQSTVPKVNKSIESKLKASMPQQSVRNTDSTLSVSEPEVKSSGLNYDDVEREYLRSKPTKRPETLEVNEQRGSNTVDASPTDNGELFEEGTLSDVSARWNPDVAIKDQLGILVDEVPPKPNFSWFRLMLLVVPGLLFCSLFVLLYSQRLKLCFQTQQITELKSILKLFAEAMLQSLPIPKVTRCMLWNLH